MLTENLCPHKKLLTDVYSSFTANCQNLEVTRMSFSSWADKLWYRDNEILFGTKQK